LGAATHGPCQGHRIFVNHSLVEVVRLTVRRAMDVELVHVRIGPAKHRLDDVVYRRERNGARHLNAPPDRRSQAFQGTPRLPHPPPGTPTLCPLHVPPSATTPAPSQTPG